MVEEGGSPETRPTPKTMKHFRHLVGATTMMLLMAVPAFGQTDSEQITGSLEIESGIQITVDANSVEFGSANPNDVAVATGTPDVQISTSANVEHEITVEADAAEMTSGNAATKDIADIEWSIDGTTWTPLSTVAQTVASGIAAGEHNDEWNMQHRVNVSTGDEPENYSASWTLTVVSTD